MNNAFASSQELYDDEFDVADDLATQHPGRGGQGAQPFNTALPRPAGPADMPGYDPVGDMVADASTAMSGVPSPQAVEVSVPRIAIHVFAERPDTLAACERAGQDRRLSRATTQIRQGGVAAAIQTYHN